MGSDRLELAAEKSGTTHLGSSGTYPRSFSTMPEKKRQSGDVGHRKM